MAKIGILFLHPKPVRTAFQKPKGAKRTAESLPFARRPLGVQAWLYIPNKPLFITATVQHGFFFGYNSEYKAGMKPNRTKETWQKCLTSLVMEYQSNM